MPLPNAVQKMHFWVQCVHQEGQEVIAILKAVLRVLDEHRGLGELLLVIHVLFVG